MAGAALTPPPPPGAGPVPGAAWINFAGMGEIDDSCPTCPKTAKLIHAARLTASRPAA
jgi:hypothetical protein